MACRRSGGSFAVRSRPGVRGASGSPAFHGDRGIDQHRDRVLVARSGALHEQDRRLARQISDLETRLLELLGQHAFERGGLGAAASTAVVHADLETERQTVLNGAVRAVSDRQTG